MSIHATAIYEKGVLKLDAPLDLAESSRVVIEIITEADNGNSQNHQTNDLEDPMSAVIGIGMGPVAGDSADQHDHYIYGLPQESRGAVIFVDTWAWIALADRRDQAHLIATSERHRLLTIRREFITTDYVLNEAITRLFPQIGPLAAVAYFEALFQSITAQKIRLERITPDRFSRAWSMRRQYADKPDISFVDLTSMVVMRELHISEAFTGDEHFNQVGLGFRIVPDRS